MIQGWQIVTWYGGCQYDQIIKFIGIETPDNQVGIQHKTGFDGDKDILNNIFDLTGNNGEMTAQVYGTDKHILRGGDSGRAGSIRILFGFLSK